MINRYLKQHMRMAWCQPRMYMPQLAIAMTRPPSSANPMPTAATTAASPFALDVTRYQCKHLEDQNKDKIKRYVNYICSYQSRR
jgi:hypothetical protein